MMNSCNTARLLRLSALLSGICFVLACELEDECDPDIDDTCEDQIDAGTSDGGSTMDTGGGTDGGSQARAPRYVWIYDLSATSSGSHPGPDIDAIELIIPGVSRTYATRVTDFSDQGGRNDASDPDQALGAPFSTDGTCDVSADPEHWYSLNGGDLVLDFGRTIPDGAEIVIYECDGVADTYGVSLGFAPRITDSDADWQTFIDEASGTFRIDVSYSALGL